jgi:anti-sigma-K factor RskA
MTQEHAWFVEHVEAFVLRHLEPDEERSFRDHVERCAECRRELDRAERELAWLPMGVLPVTPRPGLVRKLTRDVLGEREPAWRRVVPWAIAASVALTAAGLTLRARADADDAGKRLAAASEALDAARDTLSVLRNTRKVMHASVQMGGQEGGITILADPVSHRWNVVVHDLPRLPAGERYQFWFITDDGMVRGAEVHTSLEHPAVMTMGMPKEGGNVLGAALSVEPDDATTGPPQGQVLAHLML